MQDQLLSAFNNFTFHNTTQIMLSNLTKEQLREILSAVHGKEQYENLSHMIRVTLFLNLSHKIDRSLYLAHYINIQVEEFRNQRSSLIAGHLQTQSLQKIMNDYESIHERAQYLFQDEFETVITAVLDPELAIPPIRRSTVAPGCLTVYQIVLASQKIEQQETNDSSDEEAHTNQCKVQFFYQLLALQTEMADLQLSAITDAIQHFSELVFRFMVYRNTVLALHEIAPFPRLTQTMKRWKDAISKHYVRANHIFSYVAGFKQNNNAYSFGRFTPELLKQEGYLNEYIEALVDLSIDEELVAFCSHSKQNFGELYQGFQTALLNDLKQEKHENLKEQLENWRYYGLKPCTILKIIELQSICEEIKYEYCLRKDSYIQSCAKIHGFLDHLTHIIACS